MEAAVELAALVGFLAFELLAVAGFATFA